MEEQDKDTRLDLDKPEEGESEVVEETASQEAPTDEVVSEEVAEDRSAYNCSSCLGDGLVGDKVCQACLGTGKV